MTFPIDIFKLFVETYPRNLLEISFPFNWYKDLDSDEFFIAGFIRVRYEAALVSNLNVHFCAADDIFVF